MVGLLVLAARPANLVVAALLLCAVMLAACNGRSGQGSVPTPDRHDDVRITLERTACLGECPIYRLELTGDGLVRYEGIGFVERAGADSARIEPERVRDVLDAAEQIGYFNLADSYAAGDTTCPEYFPDSPSVITSIAANGRAKRVVVDHGCVGFPAGLPRLARLIDEVAGSGRWTGH